MNLAEPGTLKAFLHRHNITASKGLGQHFLCSSSVVKAIEERFGGGYAPSPGAVYPTLTLLEEQDLIQAEASEGSKKLFAITPEGKTFLKTNDAQVQGIFARIDLAAAAFARHSAPEDVREAWKTLRQAMNLGRTPWTKEEAARICTILAKAAQDIVGKG